MANNDGVGKVAISRRDLLRKGGVGFAGAMLFGTSACGGGSSGSSSTAGSSQKLSKNMSGTLTVWHYFSVKAQVKELNDFAKLFNKQYPNVKVNYVYVPYDQITNKVIAAANAKSGPDVVVYNGTSIPQFVKSGVLYDMSKFWASYPDKGQFPSSLVKKSAGKVYGVQGYVNLLGLWYNKDILDKAGVKPPRTFDELGAALEKTKSHSEVGLTLTGKPNDQGEWQAYPWLSGYGFSYGKPSAQALKGAFGFIQSWVRKGYVPQEAASWDQTEPFQRFMVGNVAFAENGNWQLGTIKGAKFRYGVVPMPKGPKGGSVYLGGETESIGAFSKNPRLAWEYLKATYLSKEGQIIALKDVGSIPARSDAAKDPAIQNDPILRAFASEVKGGSTYPPAGFGAGIISAELDVAQGWSAVIAGQKSAAAAASSVVSKVRKDLG